MNKYLLFTTKNGLVKKTTLDEYQNIRRSGLVAIKLDEDDRLLSTHLTKGNDEVLLVTAAGKSIYFSEKDVRATGRATRGVKGITLKKDDFVIGADVIPTSDVTSKSKNTKNGSSYVDARSAHLLTITENGYGKMSPLAEYNTQGRGGQGVFTHKVSDKTGNVVDMKIVGAAPASAPTSDVISKSKNTKNGSSDVEVAEDLLVVSTSGQTIRLPLSDVPSMGRQTQGVRIIKLGEGDKVAALATL